jgi:hypothetical protein
VVGNYRRGSIDKIDALFQLIERASDVEAGEFGEQHVADLLAPYHRMLDTVEKEIVRAGGKPPEDEEEDSDMEESPRGKVRGSQRTTRLESDVESEETSDSEAEKPYPDSEDDPSTKGERHGFKLYLANLSHPSVVRRKKKLPSELRKTNAILANWAHDPRRVKRKWLESPFLPEFPESELYNIIRGRVVNFDVVFSGWYSDKPEDDLEQTLGKFKIKVTGEGEPSKTVKTSQDWGVAFSLFEAAMLFAFPHRKDELNDYRTYIHQKFARNASKFHSRIIAFDRAIRKRVSRRRDLQLSDIGAFADLCDDYFSSSGRAVNDETGTSGGAGVKRRRATGPECCKRWNHKTCSRSDGTCTYRHACSKCGSAEHPEKNCTSRT